MHVKLINPYALFPVYLSSISLICMLSFLKLKRVEEKFSIFYMSKMYVKISSWEVF